MILLKATTESIKVVTTSTAGIDYSVSWVDVTTSAFSPSTSEGKISSATTTSILAAPAASTQRQVKLITITNIHATTANTVTVLKDISGTTYQLTPATVLAAGEVLIYMDGENWTHYAIDGYPVSTLSPAGSNTQIQFNNSGVLTGDGDLTWDNSSKTLALGGTDTDIIMKGITNEPSAPSAGNLTMYSKAIAGRMQLKIKGPSGWDAPLMSAIWQNSYVSAIYGTGLGTVLSQTTQTGVLPATSNIYTQTTRYAYKSVVTTQNQQVGVRTEAMFCRGNATGMGGFMFVCRFGFDNIKTGMRAFVGLTSGTTGIVTGDPSGLTNMLGFGFDLADTAWTFMHNDASGTCTTETISGQGTLATNNTAYDAYIFCAPNDSTVYYRLDRINNNTTLCDSSVTTDLPVNTTMLSAVAVMSNGTANIAAADAGIGLIRLHIETDR